MDESFKSDIYLFGSDIFFLIESKSKVEILEILKKKHLQELEDEPSIIDKRNDLLIWNALYLREIIKSGISKKYLHPLYNKFYNTIQTLTNLNSLQELEIQMVSTYLDLLINDIEIKDNYILNKILQYLHINIENHISLEKLAKALNISEGYASDCFKKHMGVSLMKYAKKIKIDRAKTLLLSTDISILNISLLLGFYDQSHFSRTFKSMVGLSPTEYRNKNWLK